MELQQKINEYEKTEDIKLEIEDIKVEIEDTPDFKFYSAIDLGVFEMDTPF